MAYKEGDVTKFGKKVAVPGSWKMKAEFKDKTVVSAECSQNFPKKWDELRSLIESTTGTSFTLR